MMKKMISLFTGVCLLLGLCACGSSARSADTAAYADEEPIEYTEYAAADEEAAVDNGWSTAASGTYDAEDPDDTAYLSGLKIIKTGNLSLQTESYENTDSMIREKVTAYQGMLTESTVSGTEGSRWASYTVRIPSASFDQFFYEVAGTSVVLSQTISSEDVTEEYTDIETRLETARTKYSRLLELLEKAETLTDVYSIQSEISDVEYEIDSLSGTLNGLDSRISYSTIYIDVEETERTVALPEEQSFGGRLLAALQNGTNNGLAGLQNFLLMIARGWVGWLIFLAIVAGIVLVVRRAIRKKRKQEACTKKSEKAPEKAPCEAWNEAWCETQGEAKDEANDE